jgi:hypothetical protein
MEFEKKERERTAAGGPMPTATTTLAMQSMSTTA